MAEGDTADAQDMVGRGSETKPPARFTEASLVKRLEELGIGRPSTYASIISTIQDRGYVVKKGSALVPTFTAFAAIGLLEQHFENLVDYAFTARMEDDLDRIASGDEEAIPWLNRFYFGNGHSGLKDLVTINLDKIDAREINSIPLGLDAEGQPIVIRVGRYGPYVTRGEDRASLPEGLAPDELTIGMAVELLEAPSGDRVLGTDPESGLPVLAKSGRFGPYVQLGEIDPDAKPKTKPKTASLFKSMSLESLTLADGLRLLTQPRVVGIHPEDGAEVTALNGRYGPYLKWGKETRSLEDEEQIFTVTLEDAVTRLAQPKQRGRRAAAPLREIGEDPASGKPITVREGRYGPYVTDGETNASLKAADTIEGLTIERAIELLAARRERGPVKKKPSAKAKKKPSAKAKKKPSAKAKKKPSARAAEKPSAEAEQKPSAEAPKKPSAEAEQK